jgi:hypothetical protein
MEYTEAYVDWNFSVEIAMQGAIACICGKYHYLIPLTSAMNILFCSVVLSMIQGIALNTGDEG